MDSSMMSILILYLFQQSQKLAVTLSCSVSKMERGSNFPIHHLKILTLSPFYSIPYIYLATPFLLSLIIPSLDLYRIPLSLFICFLGISQLYLIVCSVSFLFFSSHLLLSSASRLLPLPLPLPLPSPLVFSPSPSP